MYENIITCVTINEQSFLTARFMRSLLIISEGIFIKGSEGKKPEQSMIKRRLLWQEKNRFPNR